MPTEAHDTYMRDVLGVDVDAIRGGASDSGDEADHSSAPESGGQCASSNEGAAADQDSGGQSVEPDNGGRSFDPDAGGQSVSPPAPNGSSEENGSGPDSEDYRQGYQDGLTGNPAAPGPRDGSALIDYNEGYAKGYHEGSQPTQETASHSGPGYDPEPDKWLTAPPLAGSEGSGDALETVGDIAKTKGIVAAGTVAGRVAGVGTAETVAAAGADAVVGAAAGGIIGTAVDFATSPGGDTSLSHFIYQAVVMSEGVSVPVPGADWHRKRENAEREAKAYTDETSEPTSIDQALSKNEDDPD